MDPDLISLPWQIQFGLAAGYAAYALAYIGIRSHHKTVDVVFRTTVFSAIATSIMNLVLAAAGPVVAGCLGLVSSLLAALIWRGFGRDALHSVLSSIGYSDVDDDPKVFGRIFSDTGHDVTQIGISLDDNSELWCDDTSVFANAPITPFSVGEDGSIALYATRRCTRLADGTTREEQFLTVRDADWGDRMTLIPANRVSKIELRFKAKT